MFLEYRGEGIRFKSRSFTNVQDNGETPDLLVLDGQQRLTSIYCAMQSKQPVPTQTIKKDDVKNYYYLDILKCLDTNIDRVDAVISVPADKMIREDFGRKIIKDLSKHDGEYHEHLFPLNTVYDTAEANMWKNGYRKYHGYDEEIISRLDQFDEKILMTIIKYTIPVIQLDKTTPKEAVCQVFENVNTGGVPLTVFELVTAAFAAEDFILREDWEMRSDKMKNAEGTFELLSVIASTDFLASITLFSQVKAKKNIKL